MEREGVEDRVLLPPIAIDHASHAGEQRQHGENQPVGRIDAKKATLGVFQDGRRVGATIPGAR